MPKLLAQLATGVLDLVFAPVCTACDSPISPRAAERGVCTGCWIRARAIPHPRCDRCWTPLPELGTGNLAPCPLCPDLRPAMRCIRSAYLMEDPVRQIVHALKYNGWSTVGKAMAVRMAALDFPRELEDETPAVIPVPLAATRLRQRGYNQAALLATGIASARGWELQSEVLFRTRSSGSQTTLHPAERRANVANAFRAAADTIESIGGRHALLVDDVWTTGATTLACADALLMAGARAVSVVTFARALPEIERHSRRIDSLVKP